MPETAILQPIIMTFRLYALALVLLAVPLSLTPCDTVCPFEEEWLPLTESATATVYHACKKECNDDFLHTASSYVIVPEAVAGQRILAMERTMMDRYGIRYGDIVLLEGVGRLDGVWQVQDTMHKRFAGQEKVDLLVPESVRSEKWTDVRVSVAGNPFTAHIRSRQLNQN